MANGQRMIGRTPSCQSHHEPQPGRNLDLAKVGLSPADHRAVPQQGQTVVFPGGDGCHIRQAAGNVKLANAVVSPADNRAVAFQGQTVLIPGGNGRHIHQLVGNSGLASRITPTVVIPTPAHDRAVAFQGQTVIAPGGNRRHLHQPVGNSGLAIINWERINIAIVAIIPFQTVSRTPGDDRAVAPQGQAVVGPHGHRRHIRQPDRTGGLAIAIVSPADDLGPGAEARSQRRSRQVAQPRRVAGEGAAKIDGGGAIREDAAGQLPRRERAGDVRRRHGSGRRRDARARRVGGIRRGRERLARRQRGVVHRPVGADGQLQPAGVAGEDGAEIERGGEAAAGDGGGQRVRAEGPAAGTRVVKREAQVVKTACGFAGVIETALVGERRAEGIGQGSGGDQNQQRGGVDELSRFHVCWLGGVCLG